MRPIYGKPLPPIVKPSKAFRNFPNGEDLPAAILVGLHSAEAYCADRHMVLAQYHVNRDRQVLSQVTVDAV